MELCRSTSILRWFGALVGICCLMATLYFTARVNELPEYNYVCALCTNHPGVETCTCPTTEDICGWGLLQKMRWERTYAFVILSLMVSYSFALIVERCLKYSLASKQSRDYVSGVTAALQQNRVVDAISLASLYPESPLAAVVNASFQHRDGDDLHPSMHARQRTIVFVTKALNRGLWVLEALGWTVPLVSMFLCVSGIVLALRGMRAAEGTGIASIAGGLSESLWPTAFAMMATIPIVWSHKYLASKVGTLLLETEKLSLAIVDEIVDRQESILSGPPSSPRYITQELDPHPTFKLAD
jgi:biopolymer transport protein ExbB/TolQ